MNHFILYKYDKNFMDNERDWNVRGVFCDIKKIIKHMPIVCKDNEIERKIFKIVVWKNSSIQEWIYNISFSDIKKLEYDEKIEKFKFGAENE